MRKKAAERQNDILDVLRACEKPMTAYKILEKLQVTVYQAGRGISGC